MTNRYILAAAFCLLIAGCTGLSSSKSPKTEHKEIKEGIYPQPDMVIASALDNYRPSLNSVTGERIAMVTDTLQFGKPESPLGNLVADALRFRAGSELRQFVNIGVIGEISFRLFLTPGELTRGEVMEFMPYDNHLVVLSLTGNKVAELANQISEQGGGPVSGMRFRIVDGEARGILVNSQVLDLNKSYTVATSNWIANGGDRFPALWEYTDRIDLDVNIRQLYLDYFKSRREIEPVTDGRIRR
jgi:2',3'-cyclic-nucleotide 2'-phosphodiesterase (5'-nucleotidase family)